MTRRRKQGFTLVELLVVIGIIALLISILLPTLSKARESGKRIMCASNIRQMLLGIHNYANDHKGLIPYHISVDPDPVPGPFSAYTPYRSYAIYFITPKTWYGLGLLYEKNYIRAEQTFFCPSIKWPEFEYNTDSNPWPGRASFNYRGGMLDGTTIDEYSLKITKFNRRAVVTDLWTLDGLAMPGSGPSLFAHQKGYNVGFGDGHVVFAQRENPPMTGANAPLIALEWSTFFDKQ